MCVCSLERELVICRERVNEEEREREREREEGVRAVSLSV